MNILQKAFYFGVGLVALVGEKTTETFAELRDQTVNLADELVKRGELTSEEARKFVDEVMQQAEQNQQKKPAESLHSIEILDNDSEDEEIQRLKNRVKKLQEELSDLQTRDN